MPKVGHWIGYTMRRSSSRRMSPKVPSNTPQGASARIVPLNRTIWSVHGGPISKPADALSSAPEKHAQMPKINSNLHFPSDLERSGVPAHFGVGPVAAIVRAAGVSGASAPKSAMASVSETFMPEIGGRYTPVFPLFNQPRFVNMGCYDPSDGEP
jgi:hypothetical protein